MGSPTFPNARIHQVAAASFTIWSLFTLGVHWASLLLWPGYSKLRPTERRQWRNKITCGVHAAILAYNQAWNLSDPVLNADPLSGVTDGSFFWGSVLLGYLAYDTAYSLVFFNLRSGAAMLIHHVVALTGCIIGMYHNKLGLFGMVVEVFFEGCNPLLHVLGCMRIAGRAQGPLYRALGKIFVAQFFLFRVVMSHAYFFWLLRIVVGLKQQPWWAWAGVAVFALLNSLNIFWLVKLVSMAREGGHQQQKQQQQHPQQPAQKTAQHVSASDVSCAGATAFTHKGAADAGIADGVVWVGGRAAATGKLQASTSSATLRQRFSVIATSGKPAQEPAGYST